MGTVDTGVVSVVVKVCEQRKTRRPRRRHLQPISVSLTCAVPTTHRRRRHRQRGVLHAVMGPNGCGAVSPPGRHREIILARTNRHLCAPSAAGKLELTSSISNPNNPNNNPKNNNICMICSLMQLFAFTHFNHYSCTYMPLSP